MIENTLEAWENEARGQLGQVRRFKLINGKIFKRLAELGLVVGRKKDKHPDDLIIDVINSLVTENIKLKEWLVDDGSYTPELIEDILKLAAQRMNVAV